MNKTYELEKFNKYKDVDRYQDNCFITPNCDIYENNDAYIIEAELPGMNKENLDIQIEKNILTLFGKINKDTSNLLYSECGLADYKRIFRITDHISVNDVSAKMENGIATIVLPKDEKAKPKKVQINVN